MMIDSVPVDDIEAKLPTQVQLEDIKQENENPRKERSSKLNPPKFKFGFKVYSISEINNQQQTYFCDFRVHFHWFVDPKILKDAKIKKGQKFASIENQDLLKALEPPLIEIKNAVTIEAADPRLPKIEDLEAGECAFSERYRATLSTPIDLKSFPFDSQELKIILRLPRVDGEKILEPIGSRCSGPNVLERFEMPEWNLHEPYYKVLESAVKSETSNIQKTEFHFLIPVLRKHQFYSYNILLIVFGISSMTLLSFSILPDDIAGRLGFNMTILLTAVAFKFVIADSMPKVAYFTFLDQYILLNYCLLFLCMIENAAFGTAIVHFDSDPQIERYLIIAITGFWFFLNFWILINLAIFTRNSRNRLPPQVDHITDGTMTKNSSTRLNLLYFKMK